MGSSLVELQEQLKKADIQILRVLYLDVIGVIRAKDMLVSQLHRIHHGPTFCQGVWVTTTNGDVLDGNDILTDGLEDFITSIATESWRALPYEPGVAVAVAGALNPDGSRNQAAPRTILEQVCERYSKMGLSPIIGPELEFYIADLDADGKFRRAIQKTGRVYTAGTLVDPKGTFREMLKNLDLMNLEVFAGNHEFSPSQYEINFFHGPALDAADRTVIMKNAIRDIAVMQDQHATFIGKPWSDEGGSGFHLHFSVEDNRGKNLMFEGTELSQMAKYMIAGILKHAAAITAFTNPTVNAFKRLGPGTLAPFRANWGLDNRSAMVRIPPERGSGTRLEVRVGDGGANPYLLVAAILAAALDGIENKLECPAPVVGMAYDDESAPVLPMSLQEALDALSGNQAIREILAGPVVDIFEIMKRDELARYRSEVQDPETREVTEWEIKEYFLDF